ncbi:MAG TPA: M48 family metalloprotease [Terriglobales bacterium]|nr:M48 family metalloprotease [Terriglobales bacterium]
MMFAVRGFMVALGFFGVVYCLLSLLVVCVWRCVRLFCRNYTGGGASLLFRLRIFPLAGSVSTTLAFALPAFLRLESGAIDEDMGTLVFSACTLLFVAAGLFRVVRARAGTSRMVAEWLEGAHALDAGASGTTLQTKSGQPPLLLYGFIAPKVLVSETAVGLLSPDELQVAVRHEIGHMRSRDNLKKMILHGAPFPGMASLEQAWQEAAEFAADEAAIANSRDAIDLAAALIKLCDLAPLQDPPVFTTGLVNLTALVEVRVERLLAWDEISTPPRQGRWLWSLPAVVITVAYTVAHYSQALSLTHRATEWFIH